MEAAIVHAPDWELGRQLREESGAGREQQGQKRLSCVFFRWHKTFSGNIVFAQPLPIPACSPYLSCCG